MWGLRVFSLLTYFIMFIHVYSTAIIEKPVPRNGPFNITIQLDTAAPTVNWYKNNDLLQISEIDPSGKECKQSPVQAPVGFEFYCGDSGLVYKIEILNITAYFNVTFRAEYRSGGPDTYTVMVPTYRPKVHIEPSTSPYKIIEGNQLILTCIVDDSNPQPTSYTWSKDGGSITEQRSSVFSMTSVQRSQAGGYTCTANNGVGTGTSTSAQVDVLYPPTVSTPSIYKILESSDLSITCSGNLGNPTASYRWTGPGGYSITGAILNIPNIKRSQTGVYICTGINTMIPTSTNIQQTGRATNQTTIDVLYGPTVSVSNESVVVEESKRLNVTCTIDSNPVSTIRWYGPDSRIVSNNKDLVINKINRNQVGIYSCTASTVLQPTNGNQRIETDSKTVQVDVRYLDPVIIQSDKTYVDEGQPFNLSCSTNSNPIANMTLSTPGSISTQQTTNSINYYKATADCLDTGIYTCTAVNSQIQTSINTTQDVNIRCSPRQYPKDKSDMRVVGYVSETVQLSVSILAYPEPKFTWYKADKRITTNDGLFQQEDVTNSTNIFISTLTIKISSSDLFGDYKVKISNYINHTILTVTLTTQSVPDVPSEFILDSLSQNSICIKLKPGFDGGDTQKFIFEYSVDNKTRITSPTVELTKEGDVLNGCIENLKPDTEYFVRVIASNKFGSSEPVHLVNRQAIRTPFTTVESDQNQDSTNTALIVCFCLAIVVIIGLIVVIIYQRRQNSTMEVAGNTMTSGTNRNKASSNIKTSGARRKKASKSPNYNNLELNTRSGPSTRGYRNLGEASGSKPEPGSYVNLPETSGSKPVSDPYVNLGKTFGSKPVSGPYVNLGSTSGRKPVSSPYANLGESLQIE